MAPDAIFLTTALAAQDNQPGNPADTPPGTPMLMSREAKAIYEADMRGLNNGQTIEPITQADKLRALATSVLPPVPPPAPPPERPGIVSVASLLHKIPERARKSFELAIEESSAGNYEAAARALENAVEIDPEFAEGHANLGTQYYRLARYEEAIAELERSLALDPTRSPVHANLAAAHLGLNQFDQAAASARRALEISSSNDRARYLLALAIATPDHRQEVIELLTLAARTFPAAQRVLDSLLAK
jgi:tetratricopeptide (TPR) repeat protein